MLTLFLYCFLLGCGLQEPGPLGGTDGLEPPPGTPGPTPTAPPEFPPVEGGGLFPNAPATSDWVASLDQDWLLPAYGLDGARGGHNVDNGSHLWYRGTGTADIDFSGPCAGAAAPTQASLYEFRTEALTPWGENKSFHSIKAPRCQRNGGGTQTLMGNPNVDGPMLWRQAGDGAVYVGMYLRPRSAASGVPYQTLNYGQKLCYLKNLDAADPVVAHWIGFDGQFDGPWKPLLETQFGQGVSPSKRYTASGGHAIVRDNWNLIEWMLVPNSYVGATPAANGLIRMWVNGRLVHEASNLVLYGPRQESVRINEVSCEPYVARPMNDQYIDYGRMKIMYRRR